MCLQIKSFVVELDYRDTHGKREILNFGHTFAHGLESISNGDLCHGEAVAIGMKLACKLSVQLGLLSSHEYERILQLLAYFKLNIPYDIRPISLLYDVMLKDKKGKSNDSLRLILSNGIGKAIGVDDFKLKDLKALELSHAEC
jgi:3-dehydroquinate synthase